MLRLPETNVLRGQSHNIALGIDDTSTSTAGANVNANIVVHVDCQVLAGVTGCFAGALEGGASIRKRCHDESFGTFQGSV